MHFIFLISSHIKLFTQTPKCTLLKKNKQKLSNGSHIKEMSSKIFPFGIPSESKITFICGSVGLFFPHIPGMVLEVALPHSCYTREEGLIHMQPHEYQEVCVHSWLTTGTVTMGCTRMWLYPAPRCPAHKMGTSQCGRGDVRIRIHWHSWGVVVREDM